MPASADLLGEFEDHSPDGIRKLLAAGVSLTDPIKGKRPIDCLIEMYLRSSRFAECLQVMLDAGATVGDPLLEAILLDDETALRGLLAGSRETVQPELSPSAPSLPAAAYRHSTSAPSSTPSAAPESCWRLAPT